ncbi:MAG: MlaD family protein [Terrimicrobiaceae bacterium]|nr:MlaD family protein [Terrimicrobiaceae bacterium]
MSSRIDHGEVSSHPRMRYIWAWIFPILALAAAGWLLWSKWSSEGPEIVIAFDSAPGVSAGKTPLLYRGVKAGEVTRVALEPDLSRVRVTVRLAAFATDLARSGSQFWVEQPTISLEGAVGIEALIQGNWIEARTMGGDPAFAFEGLSEQPLRPLEEPVLNFSLVASDAPFLEHGTPVVHRGVRVGFVESKTLADENRVRLSIAIDKGHSEAVRTTSRFWIVPAADLKLSARGADISIPGLQALLNGAVAFDQFTGHGDPAAGGREFPLFPTHTAARATGEPVSITFPTAHGIDAGHTLVNVLGQTAGLVESVDVTSGRAEVAIRLFPEFDGLATAGAQFTLIRAAISLDGVSGLETLLGGPFIDLRPGPGEPTRAFVGRMSDDPVPDGVITITLRTLDAGGLVAGSPIFHRGLWVGTIKEQSLAADGSAQFTAEIDRAYAGVVRANSRFWRIAPLAAMVGPGTLDLRLRGLRTLINGAVAFETFGEPGTEAGADSVFEVFASEALAAATSTPLRISFRNGQGLVAGLSELRYLGLPVGIVTAVTPRSDGEVEVSARLRPGYGFLRTSGSQFAVVRPQISLQGVSSLETMLSGIYIECVPGSGGDFRDSFRGRETGAPEALAQDRFRIFLTSPMTRVTPGAPVLFRDFQIGAVLSKELSKDGATQRLEVGIEPRYRSFIRTNSVFLDASGTVAKIGPFRIELPKESIVDPAGRIALQNPEKAGEPVREGHEFELRPKR